MHIFIISVYMYIYIYIYIYIHTVYVYIYTCMLFLSTFSSILKSKNDLITNRGRLQATELQICFHGFLKTTN